jgi:FKBP-type peptidyl-prolyl cis-trans isomerase
MSPSGLQYKDYKEGAGEAAGPGDTCVVDWGGYTIGGWYGVGSP